MGERRIYSATRVGHVHLKVANIERALGFYRHLLGFEATRRYREEDGVLSAGAYHHHIDLDTWVRRNVPPALRKVAGLFHLAVLYSELAKALKALLDARYPINGASEALYLRDTDQNGAGLAWDRPSEAWSYNEKGKLAMDTRPFDMGRLLAELDGAEGRGPK